jgi:hypothetical protein
MMPGLFLKEIATKAGIEHPAQKLHVWTVGDRNPTQKGLARKPFTFQSSLREVRGNWYILLGVRDPARKVHELERFMLECDSKHLKRKKCSHQTPNPKFT